MVTPTLVSLAALAVLPDEVPEGALDLGEFYLANRRYLYAVLILAAIADFLQNLREAWVSTQGAIPLDHVVWRYAAPTTGIFILIVVLLGMVGKSLGAARRAGQPARHHSPCILALAY